MKTLRIACVPAEIPSEYLQSTKQKRYRYANPFSSTVINSVCQRESSVTVLASLRRMYTYLGCLSRIYTNMFMTII
jgi:hypothetical protein